MKRSKFVKFLFAGSLTAGFEFLAFVALLHVIEATMWAQVISYLGGLLISYMLNKYWVFKVNGNIKASLIKYTLLAITNSIAGGILIQLFVDVGVGPYIAKLTIMVLIAFWNFVIIDKLIFTNHSEGHTT